MIVLKVRWGGNVGRCEWRIFTTATAASGGDDGQEGREGRGWEAGHRIVAAVNDGWTPDYFLLFDRM